MTPKSPTPGSDWLASVAAENRERDDELERLRAENEALKAENEALRRLNLRIIARSVAAGSCARGQSWDDDSECEACQ